MKRAVARVVGRVSVYRACRGDCRSEVKMVGEADSRHVNLYVWGTGEASGSPGVAVKCEEIRRNTSDEGGVLDSK